MQRAADIVLSVCNDGKIKECENIIELVKVIKNINDKNLQSSAAEFLENTILMLMKIASERGMADKVKMLEEALTYVKLFSSKK